MERFRVLLVEDEFMVRVGMRNSVDWDALGLILAGEAVNGEAGWAAYRELRPDIVITDLKMPVGDGMTLIRRIRETDPRTRIVILTGVEEFETARQALGLGVSEYLVKLMLEPEELARVLRKVRAELEALGGEAGPASPAPPAQDGEEEAVRRFLLGEGEVQDFLDRARAFLDPGLPWRVALLRGESSHAATDPLARQTLVDLARERVLEAGPGWAMTWDPEHLLLFLPETPDPRETVGAVQTLVHSYMNIRLTAGLGAGPLGLADCREGYRQARRALDGALVTGLGSLLVYGIGQRGLRERALRRLGVLVHNLEAAGWSIPARLSQKGKGLVSDESFDREEVERILLALVLEVCDQSRARGVPVEALAVAGCIEAVRASRTLEAMADQVHRFQQAVRAGREPVTGLSRPVFGALQYIQAHYAEPLTLVEVAGSVQWSPNHLTACFRKELGLSFIDYLQDYRLRVAKELLTTTFKKNYEIALAIGFEDAGYFSRLFRKSTGLSPSDYRKLHLGPGEGAALGN